VSRLNSFADIITADAKYEYFIPNTGHRYVMRYREGEQPQKMRIAPTVMVAYKSFGYKVAPIYQDDDEHTSE